MLTNFLLFQLGGCKVPSAGGGRPPNAFVQYFVQIYLRILHAQTATILVVFFLFSSLIVYILLFFRRTVVTRGVLIKRG